MTMSEVFYEAACRVSKKDGYTCFIVDEIQPEAESHYAFLAANSPRCGNTCSVCLDIAAEEIGWSLQDFRTFVLLMASEAVKD